MAAVTNYLLQLIAKQVEDHSLVVWYDPERAYGSAFRELEQRTRDHGLRTIRYDGSFLQLRREIDPLLNDQHPPRLLVYVPMDQGETDHALIELEAAGVVVQPGQQPPARNTRLSLVARNALRPLRGEANAADIEKQVDAGKLSLADLDKIGDKKDSGVLSLIFGTGNPQEAALSFVAGSRFDADIEKKSARGELADLLQSTVEIDLHHSLPLPEMRDRLARHILLTDLVVGLGDTLPASLSSLKVATSPGARDACKELARSWRMRRDVRDSYVTTSRSVEESIGPSSLVPGPWIPGARDKGQRTKDYTETFACLERALLRSIEEVLQGGATPDLLDLATARQSRFWSEVTPTIQAHWALLAAVAQVLLEAERVAQALKDAPKTIPGLVKAYAEGESPWCLLDTHHRHLESRWYNFDPSAADPQPGLEKLVLKAEQRYTEVGSQLAKAFVKQFAKAKHPIPGMLRQVQVFEKHVKPRLGDQKTAYFWVDALRFEMARELGEVLKGDFDLTLQPALATIPTITEIGMASLVPRAGQGVKVVAVGGGKLGLEVAGTVLKDRKDRIAFLKAHAGVSVYDAKLDDLLPKPTKKVRDGIQGADLILITSQEIDELCEADNITQARRQMDGVLNDLRRGFRVLADLGIKRIILAADHGHLFGEEIGEDMKIEAPGGETADLHRRVWVGVGGTSEPSYLRTSLKALGVESDLDIATPWTLACFKSKGGARAYFHGGLSPQELIVPVMVMTTTAQALSRPPTGIQWTLVTGSKKLSTRFFSVQIGGQISGLLVLEPPRVRVEVRAKGKCVSVPVSASYGFEQATGDVQLRCSATEARQIEPNTVTLMVDVDEIGQKTVSISLLDATSGAEFASTDKIEVTNVL
ncbi:MAG: PglZ domain-containing protein [Isosphaeraceae bacterium]